jgi:hypothetical protein
VAARALSVSNGCARDGSGNDGTDCQTNRVTNLRYGVEDATSEGLVLLGECRRDDEVGAGVEDYDSHAG